MGLADLDLTRCATDISAANPILAISPRLVNQYSAWLTVLTHTRSLADVVTRA
jgi:hypothetical protein